MKKRFSLNGLDCANCAAKMEEAIKKLEGVESVSVNFIAQKLTIETADGRMDEVMARVARLCKKVEPDCEIVM